MATPGDNRISTMAHAGGCPKCYYVFPPIWEAAPTYFRQGHIECSECKTRADLWQVVLARALTKPSVPSFTLEQIGATRTSFMHTIEANKYHEIPLDTVGIPAEGMILQVGYTPQGGEGGAVFPIELHGNVPQRRIVGNVLRLLGRPMVSGDGTVGSVCPVSIWVLWIHQQPTENGWPYLLAAFDAFVHGHLDRVIVPAQSAVEITLMPVVRELFERHSTAKYVNAFMGDRLTFGHVINVILPFICAQAGLPQLPAPIRGSLNKLKKLRNDLVHSGKRSTAITPSEGGEALCAAVFGFEFARYARPEFLSRLK